MILGVFMGLFDGIAKGITDQISKNAKIPEKWNLINIDAEEKKFSFSGNIADGYSISYSGGSAADHSGRTSGSISKFDLRGIEAKEEQSAITFLAYKLQLIHDYMKNSELAARIAKKIFADIMKGKK